MRKRLLIGAWLGVAAVLLAVPVFAQTPVPSPTASKLSWDHDGVNTDGYKLQIDGGEKLAVTATCAVVNGVRSCELPFPALTPGNHALVVLAFNIAGEAASDPFAVVVVVVPGKPVNVRIKG
jgi:hypothetical protein